MIMLGAASTTFTALAATARADVTALAFVSGIYGANKGKNAKGTGPGNAARCAFLTSASAPRSWI